MHVREGVAADWLGILRIQQSAPEAAQWEGFAYPILVAEEQGALIGFLVWRVTVPGEAEILNLAIAPECRRRGAALALLLAIQEADVYLEVREGNAAARSLYRKAGFFETGVRPGYYSSPVESGIVMRRCVLVKADGCTTCRDSRE